MGFSGRGKNDLSYKRKHEAYCNSTASIRCYPHKGMTYAECLVIIKEFKTKQGIKTFCFVNTTKFSVTSSQHYWSIVSFKGYHRSDVTIHLDFSGSMNKILDAQKLDVMLFDNCVYGESLVKFITEYFSKKTAAAFLNGKEKRHNEDIAQNKKSEAHYRLHSNIIKMNYSNVKNFEAAILKYGLESLKSSRSILNASRDKGLLFYDLLTRLGLDKHLDSDLKNWVIENRRLKVFSELDEQEIIEAAAV